MYLKHSIKFDELRLHILRMTRVAEDTMTRFHLNADRHDRIAGSVPAACS
ncbi:hypothetical protein BLAT2472_20544 [Burkholderia latens]